MAKFELRLPKMGESVAEATITGWLKQVGDHISIDEAVVEIATDKVDSEVPSEVSGILVSQLFAVDQVAPVGAVLAIIETADQVDSTATSTPLASPVAAAPVSAEAVELAMAPLASVTAESPASTISTDRFYSPLVKNIAKEENISLEELSEVPGTGAGGRLTKADLMDYIAQRGQQLAPEKAVAQPVQKTIADPLTTAEPLVLGVGQERIPMSRMGKLVAQHMVKSVQTSAHVQSFVEVDVTRVVNWRNKVKAAFEQREGEKLTFTPIFMEAVAHALKKYPMMNISVDGDDIIVKKNINLGMAAALPDGNLIVPVIKNADRLNLVGMAQAVNDLAQRAKANQLKPDEVMDGTYTVTNVGSFGSIFGTPIINQPQVGILALGAIRKEPSVIETPEGDLIGIRSKMFLSHSYDHRVVNGALGGMFAFEVKQYLENWDVNRTM
ncbi:MAG: 2-oxo acid dehydrogenase subunit E2 [Flavobacteriaceae bacterium]|nr:2-oxo acid dehydrogenase subunit E2 [Flavobacteriaceae bacterium]